MDWDDTFEAYPSDLSVADNGDDGIRDIKEATRERMELEHNFEDGTQPFHIPGKCSVFFVGTTEEILDLENTPNGAFVFDTDLEVIKVYNEGSWVIPSIDHGSLSGLSDDDHTELLKLDKASQTLEEDLAVASGVTIDGKDISIEGALLDPFIDKDSTEITVSFINSSNEITRTSGSWITDGFEVGDSIYTTSSTNPGPFIVETVSALSLELNSDGDTVTDESDVDVSIITFSRGFQDQSTSFSVGSIYGPEDQDCIITAYTDITALSCYLAGYTGSSSPPSTLMFCGDRPSSGVARPLGLFMVVRRREYWKIVYDYEFGGACTGSVYIRRTLLNI